MSGLKLKVLPQFPSQVLGGPGIAVAKTNGVYNINIDFSEYQQLGALPVRESYALIYDPISGQYGQIPVSLLTGTRLDALTVESLPPAVLGLRRVVSDATETTFGSVVVGGGTHIVPVYATAGDWRIG